jgi:hypothetical protein
MLCSRGNPRLLEYVAQQALALGVRVLPGLFDAERERDEAR